MTCSHQWVISNCGTKERLENYLHIGLCPFLLPWEPCNYHHVKKPGLAYHKVKDTLVDSQHHLTALSTSIVVRPFYLSSPSQHSDL